MTRSRFAFASVLVAIVAVVVAALAAPLASADGDTVKVPDVAGKSRADAVALLESQGFLVATIEVAGAPPDTVESIVPPVGTDVPRNAPVTILVRRLVAVPTTAPSALKLTPAQANAALGSAYNLKLVAVTGTSEADRGTIVEQIPKAGEPLEFRGVLELRYVPDPTLSAKVTVPDVVGLNGADAEKAIGAAGLTARRAQTALPGTPPDIAIAQMPGPGTEVARYSLVDLIVTVEAKGTPPPPPASSEAIVPNLTNLTEASARAELQKVGLVGEVEWVTGDPSMIFLVVSQEPGPTSKAAVGDSVKMRIVKYAPAPPPAPTQVVVPTLIDLTQAQAEALLTALRLTANPVLVDNPAVVPFRVYSQMQLPGSSVDLGATITFRVARPPAPSVPVPVPSFYGQTVSEALATAALAGLQLDVQYVNAPGMPFNRVYSQNVAEGSVVAIGTQVKVRVSQYVGGWGTATVPNLYGKTWGQANAALAAAGLGSNGSYATTAAHPAYRVYQQYTAPGASVPAGTVIQFLVAKPPIAGYLVPNLSGRTQAQAITAISVAGLTPDVQLVPGGPAPLGFVYWQSPAPGATVAAGTVVHAKVSTGGGPGLVHVPNLIGLTALQASSTLAASGLLSVGTTIFSFGKPASRVYSQDHAAGAWVLAGTVIHWKKQPP